MEKYKMLTHGITNESNKRLLSLKKTSFFRLFLSFVFLATGFQTSAKNQCTKTSQSALLACQHEIRDDYWIAVGNCFNLSSRSEKRECRREALKTFRESRKECRDQFDAREDVCEDIGQGPFDPEIDPDNFVSPAESSENPNPYWPMVIGTTWVYEGDGETITVTITDETVEVLGVECVVVRDIVVDEDGEAVEDTVDWYAQDKDGNVWYFGEISQNFEDGELTDIEGSWKAGVDDAKPGIIMFANPEVGTVYRQEFALGNAEDMGEILDLDASASTPGADCDGDCLVTADFTPIDPGALEHKYYKPGIGFILEIKPDTGERLELISITNP